MRSLLVYPTHANCIEVEDHFLGAGIDACVYPGRQTCADEKRPPNCWNEDADVAESIGFSVVKTVCPSCKFQSDCWKSGYLSQIAAAGGATVTLCTHKRIEFAGLDDFVKKRDYLSIHENPVNLLRPRAQASEADLFQIQTVTNRLLNDPYHLNWFGTAVARKIRRRELSAEEVYLYKDRQYRFCLYLADLIDEVVRQVCTATCTTELRFAERRTIPEGTESTLFRASRRSGAKFDGSPWRWVLAAASALLHSAAVVVVSSRKREPTDSEVPAPDKRFVVGFGNNAPAKHLVTWFSDATMTADRLSAILGSPVADMTPAGRIPLQKKAVQIPRDITLQTSKNVVAGLLRGVLTDRPEARRVGVICHRPHLKVLSALEDVFASRIVKSTYFGSGEERSSNAWHQECDLIVVAGTPRVPPEAVTTYLIQIGEIGAATHEAEWGPLKWEAFTESGDRISVRSVGYAEPIWRRAHQDLVRATLVQSIGRGRGILTEGCEVVVISTEECGLLVSDGCLAPLNRSTGRVLSGLHELSPETPKYIYLGESGVKSAALAVHTGLSRSVVNGSLRQLEARGIVYKVGERSGWRLIDDAHDRLPSTDSNSSNAPSQPLIPPGLAPPQSDTTASAKED
jgi:hypothetical protein